MNRPEPEAVAGVYAVVLAAGAGTRFGGGKLQALLHGKPLAAHVAAALADAIGAGHLAGGVAVVAAGDSILARHFDIAGLGSVENADAGSGLASSLNAGLIALESVSPPAGAALVVLADQPGLRPDVIARLATRWRASGRSVRPRYAGEPLRPGHPVLLDRSLWSLASTLTGDRGMAALLENHPETLDVIDVPGTNPDVNTRGDLSRIEESHE